MIKTLLLISLTVNLSISQDVIPVNKGQAAPFTGILFTSEKANSIRLELIAKDGLVKEVESFKKTVELQDINLKIYKDMSNKLLDEQKQLIDAATMKTYEKYAWLGLGVLGAFASVYAAGALKK